MLSEVVINLKENMYEIEKNVEKIQSGRSTGFLMPNVCKEVQKRLRKNEGQIFLAYPEAEKVILYSEVLPKIRCYKIECNQALKHSSIMGSLFGLNIASETFGDIVFWKDHFYFFVLEEIADFVYTHLDMVGKDKIQLVAVAMDSLMDYQREYERLEFVVTSLRNDVIIGKIIGCNRKRAQEVITDGQVFVNYESMEKVNYVLKEEDIFSIKGHGKFIFKEIIGKTKKDNYIISVWKYL